MDPISVISLLGGVLSGAQAVFGAIDKVRTIDKVQQADAAEHEALKELERAVVDVEDDIKFFKTMISDLEPTENGHNFSLFIKRSACLAVFYL
jgi:hypothetical protein